jgi:hypothetical protein
MEQSPSVPLPGRARDGKDRKLAVAAGESSVRLSGNGSAFLRVYKYLLAPCYRQSPVLSRSATPRYPRPVGPLLELSCPRRPRWTTRAPSRSRRLSRAGNSRLLPFSSLRLVPRVTRLPGCTGRFSWLFAERGGRGRRWPW